MSKHPDTHTRRRTAASFVAAVGLGVAALTMPPASAAPASTSTAAERSASRIDRTDKAAVRSAYLTRLIPAIDTPTGWTGSVTGCVVGTESSASRKATLQAVNFYRDMVGIGPVTLNGSRNSKALAAALMMDAKNALSHSPDAAWPCYTSAGATAAGRSNLYWSSCCAGALAVPEYIIDSGSNNAPVGHRRWLLDPEISIIGTGSTAEANAIWVVPDGADPVSTGAEWIAWPPSGYVPTPLVVGRDAIGRQETLGRWSLSTKSTLDADFSTAKVRASLANGTDLDVLVEARSDNSYRYGSAIVWSMTNPGTSFSIAKSLTVRIKVSGIRVDGDTVSRTYKVKLFPVFPPAAPAVTLTSPSAGELTVSWTAPDERGALITGYDVSVYKGNPYTTEPIRSVERGVDARTATFDVPSGAAYYAFVTAHSAAGDSPSPPSATGIFVS